MSPLIIEMAFFYCLNSSADPDLTNPAKQGAVQTLFDAGLLKLNESGVDSPKYVQNEEPMKLYVKALLNVPLPARKWIIETPNSPTS